VSGHDFGARCPPSTSDPPTIAQTTDNGYSPTWYAYVAFTAAAGGVSLVRDLPPSRSFGAFRCSPLGDACSLQKSTTVSELLRPETKHQETRNDQKVKP